jgi:hypothetical protein
LVGSAVTTLRGELLLPPSSPLGRQQPPPTPVLGGAASVAVKTP